MTASICLNLLTKLVEFELIYLKAFNNAIFFKLIWSSKLLTRTMKHVKRKGHTKNKLSFLTLQPACNINIFILYIYKEQLICYVHDVRIKDILKKRTFRSIKCVDNFMKSSKT